MNLVKRNDVGPDANIHEVTTYGRTNAKEVNKLQGLSKAHLPASHIDESL